MVKRPYNQNTRSELPTLKYTDTGKMTRERSYENTEGRQEKCVKSIFLLEALGTKLCKYLNAMTDPSLLPLKLKYNNK